MAGGGLIHAAAEVHHQCRVTEPDYDHPDPQHWQELPKEALFVGVTSEERGTETELHCECYGKQQVHDREAADQIKIVSESLVCGLGDEAEKTAHHVTRTMMPRTWSTLPSLGKNSNSLGQKVPPPNHDICTCFYGAVKRRRRSLFFSSSGLARFFSSSGLARRGLASFFFSASGLARHFFGLARLGLARGPFFFWLSVSGLARLGLARLGSAWLGLFFFFFSASGLARFFWLGSAWLGSEPGFLLFFSVSGLARLLLHLAWLGLAFLCVWLGSAFFFVWLGSAWLGSGTVFFFALCLAWLGSAWLGLFFPLRLAWLGFFLVWLGSAWLGSGPVFFFVSLCLAWLGVAWPLFLFSASGLARLSWLGSAWLGSGPVFFCFLFLSVSGLARFFYSSDLARRGLDFFLCII